MDSKSRKFRKAYYEVRRTKETKRLNFFRALIKRIRIIKTE